MGTHLNEAFREVMGALGLARRRIELESVDPETSAAELRGVWGAALRSMDETAYGRVFGGEGSAPAYAIFGVRADPGAGRLQFETVDWGPARGCESLLLAAWEVAAHRGLGAADRRGRRRPFHVSRIVNLNPWSGVDPDAVTPSADPVHSPASAPCRITFPSMLRLNRRGMITEPTWPDLALAACRRLEGCAKADETRDPARSEGSTPAPAALGESFPGWRELEKTALDRARATPATAWQGEPAGFRRYSGSQRRVIEIWGVRGSLELPEGPGGLAPLLDVMRVLGIGKETVFGEGRAEITIVAAQGPAGKRTGGEGPLKASAR